VVNPAQMRQAIAAQVETDQQNREAVIDILQRSEARDLAKTLGLSLTRAEGAVSTLNSKELARLADSARTADILLTGGNNTITISMVSLLLIIIIVILLAK
jgi:hypothetical protein